MNMIIACMEPDCPLIKTFQIFPFIVIGVVIFILILAKFSKSHWD